MKILTTISVCLFVMSFVTAGYTKVDFSKIYGLRDKESLQKIIYEAEKANPSDKESLKLLGIVYHNLGVIEVKGAPEKAVNYLEKAYQLSPDDYEVLAYLGSANTMVARDSWNVVTKMSSTNKGTRMIDKAVIKSPDNIPIRMVRANNSIALPELFGRKSIAMKDFLYIDMLMEKSPYSADPETKAEVFYQLGMLYKSDKNELLAREYFKKAVEAAPNSRWGIEAKKNL